MHGQQNIKLRNFMSTVVNFKGHIILIGLYKLLQDSVTLSEYCSVILFSLFEVPLYLGIIQAPPTILVDFHLL